MIVILIVVVAVVVVAGGGFALWFVHRNDKRDVHGEVATPPLPEPPKSATTTETIETPTVEELEALLEEPPAPEPTVAPTTPEPPPVIEKPRLRDRLGRTRSAFTGAFGARCAAARSTTKRGTNSKKSLLLADVGMATTTRLLDAVRTRAKDESVTEPDELDGLLRDEITTLLTSDPTTRELNAKSGEPNVWMFVGVNGVGKTTTIGKLASQQVADGHRVVLAAADTFRAAAADQLELWAERTGGEIVRGQEGADPGSVVFDAMAAATSRGADLVLVDTAGRLHTKTQPDGGAEEAPAYRRPDCRCV